MSLKLYSWNVNGIRSAVDKGYREWFKRAQPDIVCLQETKAQPDQLANDIAAPDGYAAFWNSGKRRGYSGVALLSKIKPLNVQFELGIDRFDGEGRLIIAEYPSFFLLNTYIPNGKRDLSRVEFKLEYSDALLTHCERLRGSGKGIIICGDINTSHKEIDLAHPKANSKNTGFLPVERAWLDKFIAHGYVDTFRHFDQRAGQYTWWTYRLDARRRNIGWRLDYFFVNTEFINHVLDARILTDIYGSDHCPVCLEINVSDKMRSGQKD